jgi:hypothetical protein
VLRSCFGQSVPRVHDHVCTVVLGAGDRLLWGHICGRHVGGNHPRFASISGQSYRRNTFMGIVDTEGVKTLLWTKTLLWYLGTRCTAPEHSKNMKKEVLSDVINGARPEKAGATHIRRNLKKQVRGVA